MTADQIDNLLDGYMRACAASDVEARDAIRATLHAAIAAPAEGDSTDWKAIARVQSAKLAVAIDEPGARERLEAVMRSADWKNDPQPKGAAAPSFAEWCSKNWDGAPSANAHDAYEKAMQKLAQRQEANQAPAPTPTGGPAAWLNPENPRDPIGAEKKRDLETINGMPGRALAAKYTVALYAGRAPAVGAGWQPIETAPKDHHRLVLLFGDGPAIQSCSMVGSWRDDGCSGCWVLSPGNTVFKPTHWMPLPAAPSAAVQASPAAPIVPLAGWEFERGGDVIKVTAPDGIYWCVVRDDLAREDKIGAFLWMLIDAIAAATVAPAWQPIETAPQDTHLLLAAEFDRPGDWRIKMGYFDSKSAKWAMWGASWKPTRWQPLPAAPGGRKE